MQVNFKILIYIKEAIRCLKANKLRSFLALLGLLIGTASVVSLITIGFLAKQAAIDQFKNLGTQKLLIHFNSEHTEDLATLNNVIYNSNYSEDSPADTKNNIFNSKIVKNYHPIKSFFKSVYFDNTRLQSYQLGVTNSISDSLKLKLKSGRHISDHDSMRYFAVIGNDIINQIKQETKQDVRIGDYISIDNNNFTIIGILEHWPVDPLFSYNINRSVLVHLDTAQYLTNDYTFNDFYVDVADNVKPENAQNHLKNLLSYITPNANLQFSNAEQIFEQIEQQAHILTILLGTIGAISLIVGAIGVMNIMLVAIVERKSEIGLRMAIGANPFEIKLQFLCETVCLTSLGGLLGTIIGVLIPYIITQIAGWSFTLPLSSIFLGLLVSLGVGIISGFYPAIKASRMLPVTCLNNN